MNHNHNVEPSQNRVLSGAPPFWRSRYSLGLMVFGAAAAYFLLSEHRAHFLGALPYLLLLACPLMHVFMHHGHGRHERHADGNQSLNTSTTPQPNKTGKQP
ncbi:DUF2933 domain-containing protein [Polaromonas naphthalenivorans]|uniref:Transmembrane protein n=1 Tax=Polaromonas naphthalenivorans (strain CJ2) TaxID=365044 RepID=A1VVY4_POLNA|nr:DUF2933 domain-containing protein [Polaromonas naphthalenivorans]ABM39812.1 conserved hypothetical protein [Polaromonas naphthalenivorans CJ2]